VLGSIDRGVQPIDASASPRLPLSYPFNGVNTGHDHPSEGGVATAWIENVNTDEFEVCFHVAKPEGSVPAGEAGSGADLLSLRFNWMALDRMNPRLWYHALPFSAAGMATGGVWQLVKQQSDGTAAYRSCTQVTYDRNYGSQVPTVVATVAHSDRARIDWSSAVNPVHRPAAVAVVQSSSTGFTVCALETKTMYDPVDGWAEYTRSLPRDENGHAGCCKSCSSSKPCGQSCISQPSSCSKAPGTDLWCACDSATKDRLDESRVANAVAPAPRQDIKFQYVVWGSDARVANTYGTATVAGSVV